MSEFDATAVTEAIEACLSRPDEWSRQDGHGEVLAQSARAIIFDCAALAPIGSVVAASLVQVAALDCGNLPPSELLLAWEGAVQDVCESYGREPEGWKGDEIQAFEGSVARCFGVENDMVHRLISAFHALPEGSRIGVLMMIEEAPAFQWLSAEIDSFARQVELESPPHAIRRLMKSLYAS